MSIEKHQQNDVMVENILMQFNDAIKSQEQLNLRISRKISQIILYGASTLILLFIVVVFLTWSVQQDMESMSGYMEAMAKDTSSMNNAIGQMQSSMSAMEGGINKVANHTQAISHSIVQPDNSVLVLSHIANSVKVMQGDAQGLNKSIEQMNYNLSNINKQMKSLNRKLGAMVQDVNRMPSPVKMFPF